MNEWIVEEKTNAQNLNGFHKITLLSVSALVKSRILGERAIFILKSMMLVQEVRVTQNSQTKGHGICRNWVALLCKDLDQLHI